MMHYYYSFLQSNQSRSLLCLKKQSNAIFDFGFFTCASSGVLEWVKEGGHAYAKRDYVACALIRIYEEAAELFDRGKGDQSCLQIAISLIL